jgi:hypothetical protein
MKKINEELTQLVRTIFYECNTLYRGNGSKNRNIYPYMGKHYLEAYGADYLSAKDFKDLMEEMNIKPIGETDQYPLRVKKEYYIEGYF